MTVNWQSERDRMVQRQLLRRGISDKGVLEAFRKVPRHKFVPSSHSSSAYSDRPLSIGFGQTISQPYMVALMTELADIKPSDKVLEIGTGSGYQAAILQSMGAKVYSVERKKELAEKTMKLLKKMQINGIKIRVGDGTRGWQEYSPYNSIIVTAAAPSAPQPLLEQLGDGARLVIPVGDRLLQELVVFKKEKGKIEKESHGGCRFVPLLGEYGWQH